MIYLVIHDTLADKTLSFKFKPEIKLARIIEIFQSKYKHLEGKEVLLRFNGQPLDQEWPISKVMKDFGLKDKGKLELGLRVDQALSDLEGMDFGDLDSLGDFSDGNMTVTPEVDIDNTPAPVPMKRKGRDFEDSDDDVEIAEPVQMTPLQPDSEDKFDPFADSDTALTPPKPVSPLPKAPSVTSKTGTASVSKPTPTSLVTPPKAPTPPTKGTSSLTKSKKKEVLDEFDPLADNNFSTQVPTANVVDEEKLDIELPNDSNVDLDLDSFSKLTPHREPPRNSVFDTPSSDSDETINTDDSFDAIPAGEDSDNFLESLNEELFATGENQNALSATQTPIPMKEELPKTPAKKEATKSLSKNETLKTAPESVSKGYEEFDPLADSSLDLDQAKPSLAFEKQDEENPFFQDTSEGFPTIDPDASGSSANITVATDAIDSLEEDPFAPPKELPPLAPPPEDILPEPSLPSTPESPEAHFPLSEEASSEPPAEVSMPATDEESVSVSTNLSLESPANREELVPHSMEPLPPPVAEVPPEQPQSHQKLPERRSGTPTRYKRKILARYFRQMHPLQNYPLFLAIDKEDLKPMEVAKTTNVSKGYSSDQPWIEVIPNFPGCLVVPQRMMLNIQAPHTDCKFWITPLVADHLKEARVDLCYQNVIVQSVPLPAKINKKRVAQSFGALSLILPTLYPLFHSWGIDLLEWLPRWIEFKKLLNFVGGPVNLGIALGGFFFLLTMLAYFLQRPKENKPLQQFLDLQT